MLSLPESHVSDEARRDSGLTTPELWLRYFGLGGMRTQPEIEAILSFAAVPSAHDHDVLAHALNERFIELGGTCHIGYGGAAR